MWHQFDGDSSRAYANRYDAETGMWGGAVAIDEDSANVRQCEIAMDGAGNAILLWRSENGVERGIHVSRYAVGSDSWSSPTRLVFRDDGSFLVGPRIAMNDDGDAAVITTQDDGEFTSVYSLHYDVNTNDWTPSIEVEGVDGRASDPDVAITDDGDIFATWQQTIAGIDSVYANRFDAAQGEWGAVVSLESDDAGRAHSARVAVDELGDATVVWVKDDGTSANIQAARYSASSDAWGDPTLLETEAGDASVPRIAADRHGGVVVAWHQDDDAQDNLFIYDVYTNRYDAITSSWRGAELLEDDDGGDGSSYPDIAVNASGSMAAVWRYDDGPQISVHGRLYR